MATPASLPSLPPSEAQALHGLATQFPALGSSHRHVRCIVKLGEFLSVSAMAWKVGLKFFELTMRA